MPFFSFNFFGGLISLLRGKKKRSQRQQPKNSSYEQKDSLYPLRKALKEHKQADLKAVLKRAPAEVDFKAGKKEAADKKPAAAPVVVHCNLKRDPSLGTCLEPLTLTESQANALDRRVRRFESIAPEEWVNALRRSTTTAPSGDSPNFGEALHQFITAENENLDSLFQNSPSMRKKAKTPGPSPSASRHLSMSWTLANAAETRAAANSIRNLQLSASLSLMTHINNMAARRSTCATPGPEVNFGKVLEGFVEDQQRVKTEAFAKLEKMEPTVVSYVQTL